MLLPCKIQFYDIEQVGYYKYRTNEHKLCSLDELLDGLDNWLQGKTIKKTMTFTPKDDSDQASVYCYDFFRSSQIGSTLTILNSNPTNQDGQVVGVNLDGDLGTSEVQTSNFQQGYLPGYHTYFWFPPSVPFLATIRFFDRTQNGHSDMCLYLRNFLTFFHPYAFNFLDSHSRFLYGPSRDTAKSLRPAFLSRRCRLPGELDTIRNSRARIRKIIRQASINPRLSDSRRQLWQSVLDFSFLRKQVVQEEHVDLTTSFSYVPSKKELEEMIAEWEKNIDNGDVGVQLVGEQNIYWFNKSLANCEFTVNVDISKHEIVNAESLAVALSKNRDTIFARAFKNITNHEQIT